MTRSNGLGAPAFAALAEFEPALDDQAAQAVLRRLERAGIAAYLADVVGGDQLFVDSRQTRQAWVLLAPNTLSPALTGLDHAGIDSAPEHPAPTIDEDVWASLVESYNAADAEPIGRWPSIEDADPDGGRTGPAGEPAGSESSISGAAEPDSGGWEHYLTPPPRPEPAAPADEHFQPPEPPPMPPISATAVTGWLAALGIPVALVVVGFLGIFVPTWVLLLAGGGFVYGLITLFSMLRSEPMTDDEGPDDDSGAQV